VVGNFASLVDGVRGSNFASLVAGFVDFAALVLGWLRFARRKATSLRLCRLCRRRAGRWATSLRSLTGCGVATSLRSLRASWTSLRWS